jgi:predicted lipoprotein with Yx(FWY)xxD motif
MEINWRCTGLIMYDLQTYNTTLGEILVDGSGYTLYTFAYDSINKSTCSGTCASTWPPFILNSDEMTVPKPILHRIGILARNSTAIQLTFDGMPLYYYAGDANPGDTNGQGIDGKWYVVNASG